MRLCACPEFESHLSKIRIQLNKRHTVIIGINPGTEEVTRKLKKSFGAGGWVTKKGKIFLQGDHRLRLSKILMKLGVPIEDLKTTINPPLLFLFRDIMYRY